MSEKKKKKKDKEKDKGKKPGAVKRRRFALEEGQMIKKYEVVKLIKSGGFCDVYEVLDITTDKHYAMKIEPCSNKYMSLKQEKDVYDKLKGLERFPKIIEYIKTDDYIMLIMELLGCNLHDVRKIPGMGCVPKNTGLRIALEMLRCIEDLHGKGILHRDIKPQNFLIRPYKRYPVCLIDYGHSFIFLDERGNRIRKDGFEFAGTPSYCSPEVLNGSIPTERDDYFGWILSVIEMLNGMLPWFELETKQEIKEAISKEDGSSFEGYIPDELIEIYKMLKDNDLDKEKISFLVGQAIEKNYVEWDDTYIWEEIPTEDALRVSPIPLRPSLFSKPISHLPEQKPVEFFYHQEPPYEKRCCCLLV